MPRFRIILLLSSLSLALCLFPSRSCGKSPTTRVAQPPVVQDILTPPMPLDSLPSPRPARPFTHREFAGLFQPQPGNYEVVLTHPVTCCPVKVCFCLPPGCPKKVRVHPREIVFDYGRDEVEIRFIRTGQVRVAYR